MTSALDSFKSLTIELTLLSNTLRRGDDFNTVVSPDSFLQECMKPLQGLGPALEKLEDERSNERISILKKGGADTDTLFDHIFRLIDPESNKPINKNDLRQHLEQIRAAYEYSSSSEIILESILRWVPLLASISSSLVKLSYDYYSCIRPVSNSSQRSESRPAPAALFAEERRKLNEEHANSLKLISSTVIELDKKLRSLEDFKSSLFRDLDRYPGMFEELTNANAMLSEERDMLELKYAQLFAFAINENRVSPVGLDPSLKIKAPLGTGDYAEFNKMSERDKNLFDIKPLVYQTNKMKTKAEKSKYKEFPKSPAPINKPLSNTPLKETPKPSKPANKDQPKSASKPSDTAPTLSNPASKSDTVPPVIPENKPQPTSAVKPANAAPAKIAPAKTASAKADSAKADSTKAAPAKASPATAAPANTASAKTAPAKSDSVKTDPARADPAKAASSKTVPAKTVPAKTDSAKADSAKADSTKAAPAKAAPAKAAPATAPKNSSPQPLGLKPNPRIDVLEEITQSSRPNSPKPQSPSPASRPVSQPQSRAQSPNDGSQSNNTTRTASPRPSSASGSKLSQAAAKAGKLKLVGKTALERPQNTIHPQTVDHSDPEAPKTTSFLSSAREGPGSAAVAATGADAAGDAQLAHDVREVLAQHSEHMARPRKRLVERMIPELGDYSPQALHQSEFKKGTQFVPMSVPASMTQPGTSREAAAAAEALAEEIMDPYYTHAWNTQDVSCQEQMRRGFQVPDDARYPAETFAHMLGFDPTGLGFTEILEEFSETQGLCDDADCPIHESHKTHLGKSNGVPNPLHGVWTDMVKETTELTRIERREKNMAMGNVSEIRTRRVPIASQRLNGKPVFGPEVPPSML